MPEVNALVEQYCDRATFAMVYIEEAHASDEWPIYQLDDDIKQHKTLDERCAIASKFKSDFSVHPRVSFVTDAMTNEFNHAYASWPFRFWVIDGSAVTFKPMPKNCTYELGELQTHLEQRVRPC